MLQYEKHKKAGQNLKDISNNLSNHLIIHYSCESFYDIKEGKTPRITSIAICSCDSAQTESFSIHKIAEKEKVLITEIKDKYDYLEKKMLTEYFEFVGKNENCSWVHWNMRDINYGFQAIEHRFEVLEGTPVQIHKNNRIDLARILKDRYGLNYANSPRMEKTIEQNNISSKDILSGSAEAKAFEEGEYIRLHQSTLRKVCAISSILDKAVDNKLKVQSKWSEVHGVSAQSFFDYARNKWWGQIIIFVIGALIGKIFLNF